MAVTSKVSENAFTPYRGTEAQCQAFPSTPGAIFFAYDTNKIYFDDKQGVRHVMSGSGIKFVYGDIAETLVPTNDSGGYLPYPREAITAAYDLINKPVETYQVEDMIISRDGTFYRIKRIDDEYCYVEKVLVAGTGGGGGDAGSTISIQFLTPFPSMLAKGQDPEAVIRIVDTKRGNEAEIDINFYSSRTAQVPYREVWSPDRVLLTNGVGTMRIKIPSDYIRVGKTVLQIQAWVNNRSSDIEQASFTNIDIEFAPTNQWNPQVAQRASDQVFTFPWEIRLGEGIENISEIFDQNGTIEVTATVDAASSSPTVSKENILSDAGVLDLFPLFESKKHGAHTLDIVAIMKIGNTEVEISKNLHYEIGWITSTSGGIIIWSPFPHDGEVFVNYTLIDIPYVVIDPSNTNREIEVTYYINEEESSSENIVYAGVYNTWEVARYIVGMNEFTIQAEDVTWSTTVKIETEPKYSLEPTPGSILYLTAQGRTNNESPVKRQTWKNEIVNNNGSNKVLKKKDELTDEFLDDPVVLSGFNWYNNGWLKDSDGNTALRVSNGASVFIPMTLFQSGGGASQGQTYEFDFAVRNAVDYSRLINISTVYLREDELADNKWFDEDERVAKPYDLALYTHDEEGFAIEIATGNKVPKQNEKTGDDIVQRTVSSSSDSAFLTYYASNKGIVLGTQEAFLALNTATLVAARYTDNTRVKVSFTVDKTEDNDEPLIYAYINGILTSVLPFSSSTDFTQTFNNGRPGITITSDCCDVDIYNIRVYEQYLNFAQIGQNWTADAPNLPIKKARYLEGKKIVNDAGTNLDYRKVKESKLIPVMTIKTYDLPTVNKVQDELPYYKGNKIGADIFYYDPITPVRSFHAQNCQLNVQGTSSQGYPRRNFKFSLKAGSPDWADQATMDAQGLEAHPFLISHWDGDEANRLIYDTSKDGLGSYITYKAGKTRDKDKGTIDIGCGLKGKSFCLKADYMDSSSSHNTPGANLVTYLSTKIGDDYDLRHPLNRMLGSDDAKKYRTTVYGFPILVFWENGAGTKEFIGRYNFNVDKSSENIFGFTDATEHPYYTDETLTIKDVEVEKDGATTTVQKKYILRPAWNSDDKIFEDAEVPCDYEHITECWELTNNQPGHSKFQDGSDEWLETAHDTATNQDYYVIYKHFEQRYPEMETTSFEGKENKGNNEEWALRTGNLKKLWEWIRSTDVTSYDFNDAERIKRTIEPIYYPTLSTSYEPNISYFTYDQANNTYSPAVITINKEFTVKGAYQTAELEYDDTNRLITPNLYSMGPAEDLVVEDSVKFLKFLRKANDGAANEDSDAHDKEYIGTQGLIWDTENLVWTYGNTTVSTLSDIGITLNANKIGTWKYIEFEFKINYNGFDGVALYEYFTVDTNRYRLCKFKNEFTQHFNLDYVLFYFIYTEFFLLYDSRQKNMMISSWGPEKPGGEYIWYPIFYDLDTQLGVNNSGQVYWDYDEDATPPLQVYNTDTQGNLITRTINGVTYPDIRISSSTGITDSIFSGNGSVLWNNVYLCFKANIIQLYKQMRNGNFKEDIVNYYYETASSDKWSAIMKNYDAYYKYLAPATIGFTNQDHEHETTSDYYYCLQGDRHLQRITMIRNRFNYLDSEWGGGPYDPVTGKSQIKMRYNLNQKIKTSFETYPSSAVYVLTPYLSQYVSVIYDETASELVKYALGGAAKTVTVNPPMSIAKKANLGIALTQQLAYIRGPEYISDLGDLAPKYLNEFVFASAKRLRRLKLGDDRLGYKNTNLTSLSISPKTGDNIKGLLTYVDISNLSELRTDPSISACNKLTVLKMLGTNIGDIALPQGSILTTVYLPSTISTISLERPLRLTNILTTVPDSTEPIGLFIENLTEKIPAFESGATFAATAYTTINKLQLDDTQLGYDSYRILNYLYNLKLAAQAGTVTGEDAEHTTHNELLLSLTNVNWTPYIQMTEEDSYNPEQRNNYYERQDMQYEPYVYDGVATWIKDVKNGIVYLKDTEKGESPITNLSMFEHFYQDLDNRNIRYDDYFFRPLRPDAMDPTKKLIPTITGKLHVHNDVNHKIKEAEVYAYLQSATHFPKLDVTADYVIPANKARFIEYLPDGTVHEFGVQKYAPGIAGLSPIINYTFETPSRNHYDFLGWSVLSDTGFNWEEKGSVNNDWMLGPDDSKNNNDKVVNASGTTKSDISLSQYSLEGEEVQYTFVAVFAYTGYIITYLMDDGSPIYTYNPNTKLWDGPQLTTIAIAGQNVEFTNIIPWKNDSALQLTQTYRFKGWRLSNDPEAEVHTNDNPIKVDRNTAVYATFDLESVYANPLGENELEIQLIPNQQNAIKVTPKLTSYLRGKICIPSQLTCTPEGGERGTYKVLGLLSAKIENSGFEREVTDTAQFDGGNLSWQPYLTHVFFSGCDDRAGVTVVPDYIETFHQACFYNDTSLVYVDIPKSLLKINSYCFQKTQSLSMDLMNDFKNVAFFDTSACYNAYGQAYDDGDYNLTLRLSANVYNGAVDASGGAQNGKCRNYSLGKLPLKKLIVGSTSNPINVTGDNINAFTSTTFAETSYVQEILAYAKATMDTESLRANLKQGFPSNVQDNIDITIVPVQ